MRTTAAPSIPARTSREHDEETVLVLAHWRYVATGHRTVGDAFLAASAAARAREHRLVAREELTTRTA